MSVAFVTANNQEESEVAKLDDARNDCNQPLSTSFSHFLFPGEEQVRGQSPRGFCDSHLNSIVPFFPPHLQMWLCYSYSGLHCGINSIYCLEEQGWWYILMSAAKSCCPSSIMSAFLFILNTQLFALTIMIHIRCLLMYYTWPTTF